MCVCQRSRWSPIALKEPIEVCGRFVAAAPIEEIAAYFSATLPDTVLPKNYNVAPTEEVYGVIDGANGRQLQAFHWGLVPFWAKDRKIAARMINCRAETVTEKPAFARLFSTQRCIVPADGFFEWQTLSTAETKPVKQPHYIRRADGEPLAMAGIWSSWRDPSGESTARLRTLSIITTAANELMRPLHDRMPVLLASRAWNQWLDPETTDIAWLTGMLTPAPNEILTRWPVATDVNSVRNKSAQLIEQVPLGASGFPLRLGTS